jgi:starvation-inducible outer membrane lipoprotein
VKSFDDEESASEKSKSYDDLLSNPDSQSQRQERRGPKIIKFKQKKPSERLALSQLKSEQDDKSDKADIYAPKNE